MLDFFYSADSWKAGSGVNATLFSPPRRNARPSTTTTTTLDRGQEQRILPSRERDQERGLLRVRVVRGDSRHGCQGAAQSVTIHDHDPPHAGYQCLVSSLSLCVCMCCFRFTQSMVGTSLHLSVPSGCTSRSHTSVSSAGGVYHIAVSL